jgi:rhamnulokinase
MPRNPEFLTQSPCFVAADLGAGSGRVMAGQIVQERLLLREAHRFPNGFAPDPASGSLCWAIDEIEAQVRWGIAQAAALAPVAGVGVDSWGVDFVLLDASLRRVGGAVCYRDSRTEGMIERLCQRLPAAEIYRRTGIQFQPFNTICQLAALAAREPALLAQATRLLMIPDYLHFRLSGVMANEYTNATTTQLLNTKGLWERDLLAAAGAQPTLMEPPVAAGTVLGQLRMDGLAAVKVVAPATHDTASAVVGTPFADESEAFLSSGTWSLMGMESLMPFASEQARQMNFSNEGGFQRRFRVLKNIMGLWLLQRVSQEFGVAIDDALLKAAAQTTPWRSLVNPDDARFLNPPSMRQAITEFCRETQQPEPVSAAEFARCACESLALCYRQVKENLESLRGAPLTRIRIVGGGSKNRFLNQLCANACQLPVSAGPVEASALGNLCAQMIALGVLANLAEARALVRRSFECVEFQPREEIPNSVLQRFKGYAADPIVG